MLLVPRQLQRHGMTGAVPYYGGRLTPAHIQGLKDAQRPGPPPGPPVPGAAATPAGVRAALEYLLAAGVITRAEFDAFRARRRL